MVARLGDFRPISCGTLINREKYLEVVREVEDDISEMLIPINDIKAILLPPEKFRFFFQFIYDDGAYGYTIWSIPVMCAPIHQEKIVYAQSLEEILAIYGGSGE